MGKKVSLIGLSFLIMALLVSTVVSCAKPKAPETIVWKYQVSPTRVALSFQDRFPAFEQKVIQKSNGRLKIEAYGAGELGFKGSERLRLIKEGIIQASCTTYTDGDYPPLGLLDLPGIWKDQDEALRVARQLIPVMGPALEKKFDAQIVGVMMYEEQNIVTNKRVLSLKDLQDVGKIRVWNLSGSLFLEELKASPVLMPGSELYVGLQKGVVNGCFTGASSQIGFKVVELCKYAIRDANLGLGLVYNVVSKTAFEALPKDLQQVVLDSFRELSDVGPELSRKWGEQAYKEMEKDWGMEVNTLPPEELKKFRDAGEKVWPVLAEKGGPETIEIYKQLLKLIGK